MVELAKLGDATKLSQGLNRRRDGAAVTDLGAAAAHADIISCATLAHEPVVQGAWLRAGQHLDLIGSFTPQMREADDDCFRGARVFVDVREALVKSGDLTDPMSRGATASPPA